MTKSNIQEEHKIIGTGIEKYIFKLKDKVNRNAIRISNPDGTNMILQVIEIVKVVGQNNKIEVTLRKGL